MVDQPVYWGTMVFPWVQYVGSNADQIIDLIFENRMNPNGSSVLDHYEIEENTQDLLLFFTYPNGDLPENFRIGLNHYVCIQPGSGVGGIAPEGLNIQYARFNPPGVNPPWSPPAP